MKTFILTSLIIICFTLLSFAQSGTLIFNNGESISFDKLEKIYHNSDFGSGNVSYLYVYYNNLWSKVQFTDLSSIEILSFNIGKEASTGFLQAPNRICTDAIIKVITKSGISTEYKLNKLYSVDIQILNPLSNKLEVIHSNFLSDDRTALKIKKIIFE